MELRHDMLTHGVNVVCAHHEPRRLPGLTDCDSIGCIAPPATHRPFERECLSR